MGLFFTLLYIMTAYLAPQTVFGDLAYYHIEVFIALIALVTSLPNMDGSGLSKMAQSYALLGLIGAVVLSFVFNGLTMASSTALLQFLPSAAAFFFIVVNCKKVSHLKLLVGVLLCCALFIVFKGWYGLRTEDADGLYVLSQGTANGPILRIRGLSFLNDPNDLAQVLVSLIPCVFIFWKRGNVLVNSFLVYIPVGILLYGMFLTHSRGGMVALTVACMVAGRRKIGLLPSGIIGGALFIGLSAAGWTGGRDISAASGADRMEAWSTGLELIRAHPLFGVGYLRFDEFYYITAHNTVIVCAAEVGLIGLFFWMLFIFPTMRNVIASNGDDKRKQEKALKAAALLLPSAMPFAAAVAAPSPVESSLPMRRAEMQTGLRMEAPGNTAKKSDTAPWSFPDPRDSRGDANEADIQRMSALMMISFAGFLAAGWFLSRAFPLSLYTEAGITAVVYKIGLDRGLVPPPLAPKRLVKYSAGLAVGLVLVVYVIIRIQHFVP